MNEHQYLPVTDELTGSQIAQCTRCGHRWYGKGEERKPCVPVSICSECGLTPSECARSRVKCCPDCSHTSPVFEPVFFLEYYAAGDSNVLTSRDTAHRVALRATTFDVAILEAREEWAKCDPARNWLSSPRVICPLKVKP